MHRSVFLFVIDLFFSLNFSLGAGKKLHQRGQEQKRVPRKTMTSETDLDIGGVFAFLMDTDNNKELKDVKYQS